MTNKKVERNVQIHFRVSSSEYEHIKKNVSLSGLSMSEYSRRLFKGEKIIAAPPSDFFILIKEIKRVGSNLNQLIRKLNTLGVVHDLELQRCVNEIDEARKLIVQTYRPGKGDG